MHSLPSIFLSTIGMVRPINSFIFSKSSSPTSGPSSLPLSSSSTSSPNFQWLVEGLLRVKNEKSNEEDHSDGEVLDELMNCYRIKNLISLTNWAYIV